MPHLRQSTVGTINVGPMMSNDTGTLPLTNLTIVPGNVFLSKNGAAWTAKNHSGTGAHGTRGHYHVVIDATDTNTLGRLSYDVTNGTALPAWGEYEVIETTKFDSIYGTNSIPTGTAEAVLSAPAPASGTIDLAVMVNSGTVDRVTSVGTSDLAVQVNSGTVDRANSVPDPTGGTMDLVGSVSVLSFDGSDVNVNVQKIAGNSDNDGVDWGTYFMQHAAEILGTINKSGDVYTYRYQGGDASHTVTIGTSIKTVS